MIDLKGNPFYLDGRDIKWVNETLAGMSNEEKIGQLFCLIAKEGTKEELDHIYSICKPGGIMYRPMSMEQALDFTKQIQEKSGIPMLIAANLEKGGNGIVEEGTILGAPLEVAATDDVEMAEKLGILCAKEGGAVGANWAFAPIIDIDYNFRNPITNTRTFGSDPQRVKSMGVAYVKAVQAHGFAASIKHFPGDGMDERDQHLVTSINSTTVEEWDNTYGQAYSACMEAGALTCMIGHILHPEYSKKLNPALKDEEILPASLSKELMTGLLRDKLGFNGMIVTDATTMAGYTIPMPRAQAVPLSIAAGADMFLFAKSLEEDVRFMKAGVESGIITEERLDEAVIRILATKAALKLYENKELPTLEEAKCIIGCAEHQAWSKECADKAITLVKEEAGVLPLSTENYKKVLFYPIESDAGYSYSVKAGVCADVKARLEKEGFEVDEFVPEKGEEGRVAPTTDYIGKYDLIIYLGNMSTKSNQTTVRIEWAMPMGANCAHYITSIPTIFISMENPYHLLDIPRVRTFINAYNSNDNVIDALLDKLMGRSEFKGVNPVDPFCGKWDAHLK